MWAQPCLRETVCFVCCVFQAFFCFFCIDFSGLLSLLYTTDCSIVLYASPSSVFIYWYIFFSYLTSWLLVFTVPDTTCDTTQPDTAGSRWPGQQGVLCISWKSGDHVGARHSCRLQPDEPASPEPAAGPLVQPGQAAGARSEKPIMW